MTKPISEMSSDELYRSIRGAHRSHDLTCRADEYNALWAELLSRLPVAASQPGEPPSQKVIEEYQRTWRENNNKGPFGHLSSDVVNDLLADFAAQFFGPSAPSPQPRLMISRSGEVHEYCPDCRGECSEYRPKVECLARKSGTAGGNYPQDCDWPFCGCDERATKVIEALIECGWKSPKETSGVAPSGSAGPKQALCRNCQAVHEIGGKCPSGETRHSREQPPDPPAESAAGAKGPRYECTCKGRNNRAWQADYDCPVHGEKAAESAVVSASPEQEWLIADKCARKIVGRIINDASFKKEGPEPPDLNWTKCGIVELAVRNPNVASYVEHWEGRAQAAEAELAALPAKWKEDSSLETWFPLTAEELARTKKELAELRAGAASHNGQGWVSQLKKLRDEGWMVAVHNDYRQDGKHRTFWLFTRVGREGQFVKGEGETDADALQQIIRQLASHAPAPPSEANGPKNGVANDNAE